MCTLSYDKKIRFFVERKRTSYLRCTHEWRWFAWFSWTKPDLRMHTAEPPNAYNCDILSHENLTFLSVKHLKLSERNLVEHRCLALFGWTCYVDSSHCLLLLTNVGGLTPPTTILNSRHLHREVSDHSSTPGPVSVQTRTPSLLAIPTAAQLQSDNAGEISRNLIA